MVENAHRSQAIRLEDQSRKKSGKPTFYRLIFVSGVLLRFAICPGDDILAIASIAPITGSGIQENHQAVLPNKIEIVDERILPNWKKVKK